MYKQALNIPIVFRLVGATLAVATPALAWGLGLGDITLKSYLNEPLAAEVELLDVQNLTADDVRVRLATQEAFDRLGVDRAYFLTSISFEVVIEDGGFVGAASRLAPGVRVKAGALVKAAVDVYPDTVVEKSS